MRRLTKISHRLRSLFRKDTVDLQLDDELKYHVDREIQEKIAAGMSLQQARRTAMIEFGAFESIREECKDMRKMNLISNLIRDIKFGARMLRKNPGFTAIALLTLALGIGANAAIFSLVRGVLLRPLVNRDENRLIYIRQTAAGLNVDNIAFSVPEVDDLRASVKSVSEFGEFSQVVFTMLGLGEPRVVRAGVVDGSYFEVVGLHPVLGRLLDMRDDGPKAEGAVVLTYHFWTTGSASVDPSVIGKSVRLDRRSRLTPSDDRRRPRALRPISSRDRNHRQYSHQPSSSFSHNGHRPRSSHDGTLRPPLPPALPLPIRPAPNSPASTRR